MKRQTVAVARVARPKASVERAGDLLIVTDLVSHARRNERQLGGRHEARAAYRGAHRRFCPGVSFRR